MNYQPNTNPYIKLFQTQYEKLCAYADFSRVRSAVERLLKTDEQELVDIFSNELGNTWTMYGTKLAGKNIALSAVSLKWDGDGEEPFVPTIVLADAYESYSLKGIQEHEESPVRPGSEMAAIHAKPVFAGKVFDELGGFDIDFVTDHLFELADDGEVNRLPVYEETKTLFIIKTLDLAYRAVKQTVSGDRFGALPKRVPFAFFANTGQNRQPFLIFEVTSL